MLKPGAKIAVVEIQKTDTTFGPPLDMRFSFEEIREKTPLALVSSVKAGEYFDMYIFLKNE